MKRFMKRFGFAIALIAVFLVIGDAPVFSAPETDLTGRTSGESTLLVDCPHSGDTNYDDSTGINVSTTAYSPTNARNRTTTIHGLILTHGSGFVSITMEGGGVMQLPFTVDTMDCEEFLKGYSIKSINKTGTTFTGSIFPLF